VGRGLGRIWLLAINLLGTNLLIIVLLGWAVKTSFVSVLVATTTAGPRFENIVPAGRGAVTVPEIWPKAWPATAKSKSALPICQRAAIGRRDEAFTGVSSFAIGQGPALEACGPVRSYSPGLQSRNAVRHCRARQAP